MPKKQMNAKKSKTLKKKVKAKVGKKKKAEARSGSNAAF
jgi:hypothetical protein